jgi:hypothetical protein
VLLLQGSPRLTIAVKFQKVMEALRVESRWATTAVRFTEEAPLLRTPITAGTTLPGKNSMVGWSGNQLFTSTSLAPTPIAVYQQTHRKGRRRVRCGGRALYNLRVQLRLLLLTTGPENSEEQGPDQEPVLNHRWLTASPQRRRQRLLLLSTENGFDGVLGVQRKTSWVRKAFEGLQVEKAAWRTSVDSVL